MSMDDGRRAAYLEAMGIEQWTRRGEPASHGPMVQPMQAVSAPRARAPVAVTPPRNRAGGVPADVPELERLRQQVKDCRRCELAQTRIQTVFGVGSAEASLMIIGEAPGAEEDARGEPFVGRAGQLLNAMLAAIGLDRETVYIANILKCRPPRNRDPLPQEVEACSDYLNRQIALVEPRILLAVGRIAAQNLLGVSTPIGKMRGREHLHPGTGKPVLVTYHPAYLLRSPREKRKVWADLCALRTRLQEAP